VDTSPVTDEKILEAYERSPIEKGCLRTCLGGRHCRTTGAVPEGGSAASQCVCVCTGMGSRIRLRAHADASRPPTPLRSTRCESDRVTVRFVTALRPP